MSRASGGSFDATAVPVERGNVAALQAQLANVLVNQPPTPSRVSLPPTPSRVSLPPTPSRASELDAAPPRLSAPGPQHRRRSSATSAAEEHEEESLNVLVTRARRTKRAPAGRRTSTHRTSIDADFESDEIGPGYRVAPPLIEESERSYRAGPAEPPSANGEATTQCLSSLAMDSLSKPEHAALVFRLRAARYVVQGGRLVKFLMGKRRRHGRFFRARGSSGTLQWGRRVGHLLVAEASPFPDEAQGGARLQQEQNLSDEELARCFQITLRERQLFVMAFTLESKQLWVAGINALLSGLYF